MRRIVVFTLALAIVSCALADDPQPKHLELARQVHADARRDGHTLINTHMMNEGGAKAYIATRERMSHTPEWDTLSDPPLPLAEAIAIARKDVLKGQPEGTELLLTSSGVYMIHSDDFQNRYNYIITLQKRIPTESGWTSQNWDVYILMDGTIIEPIIYPKK